MGEIAEMMLDGTLCAQCGIPIVGPGEEPAGYPGYCSRQCAEAGGEFWEEDDEGDFL